MCNMQPWAAVLLFVTFPLCCDKQVVNCCGHGHSDWWL